MRLLLCATLTFPIPEVWNHIIDNASYPASCREICVLVSTAWMVDHASAQAPDWSSDDAVEGHSLIEAAAGSVTMRGLLYSLMQPAPRRFLSLKSPALFTTNKAALLNKAELQRMCWLSDRSVKLTTGVC